MSRSLIKHTPVVSKILTEHTHSVSGSHAKHNHRVLKKPQETQPHRVSKRYTEQTSIGCANIKLDALPWCPNVSLNKL